MVETDGSSQDVDTMEPAATIVLSAATNEHSAAATAATVGELTATSVDTDKQNETAETTAATVTADILSAASAFITEAATLPTYNNSEDTLNAEHEQQTVAAVTESGLAAAESSVVQDDKAAPEANSHTAGVGSGCGEDINSEIKAPEKSDETAATAITAITVAMVEDIDFFLFCICFHSTPYMIYMYKWI